MNELYWISKSKYTCCAPIEEETDTHIKLFNHKRRIPKSLLDTGTPYQSNRYFSSLGILEAYWDRQKNKEFSFAYSLLDRMRSDCEFYLGAYGNRNNKYLWGGTPDNHIYEMRKLYNYLKYHKAEPQWLTEEQIEKYAKEMNVQ